MPSANAASLGKYGDIPVSYYTGVPNIGIPIHTLTEGPISLPISLSYHAGGVKVGEPSSWVGLGWSLSAGGMISRTVQGRADESCFGYFNVGKDVEINSVTNCIVEQGSVTNGGLANGSVDGEPDIFFFSIGGYSGKFYIGADLTNNSIVDGPVVLIPKQDVKVEYSATESSNCANVYRLQNFTITTPDGIKYIFGSCGDSNDAIEIMENDDNNFWHASGWYLKKIISADETNNIILKYTAEKYRYANKASGHVNVVTSSNGSWPQVTPTGSYYTHAVDIKSYRLNYVQTSTETVTFYAGTDRTTGANADLGQNTDGNAALVGVENAKLLDSISIVNGTSTYCKSIVLTRSFFQDNDATHKSGQYTDFRPRLDAVQERACNCSAVIPPHTFTYYGKTGNLNYLPNRLSSAIDHWGYNNDATTNPHSGYNIPYTRLPTYTISGTTITPILGASNRESNEEAMKWGTIQQIKYPTGGNTLFEFEANTVWDEAGVSALQDEEVAQRAWDGGDCANDVTYNNSTSVTKSITYVDGAFYTLDYRSAANHGGICNDNPSFITIYVYQGTTQICSTTVNTSTAAIANTASPILYQFGVQSGKLTDIFPCLSSAGTYTFKFVGSNCAIKFTFKKQITLEAGTNRKVGGLRIKRITSSDGVNAANNVVKTYNYNSIVTNLTNRSSAIVYSRPVYGTNYAGSLTACSGIAGITSPVHFFMDNSIVPLGSFEGNHIGYSSVKEYSTVLETGQYSLYEYSNAPMPSFTGLPMEPAQPRIGMGELTKKTQFNNSAAEVASETYTVNPETDEGGVGTYVKFNTYQQGGGGTAISFWKKYDIKTRPYRLSSRVSIIDGVTTTTSYAYRGFLPPYAKQSETVTNSNGIPTTTFYYYPSDMGASYAHLVSRYMVFPVSTMTATGNAPSPSDNATKWAKVEYNALAQPQYLKECLNNADFTNAANWITRMYIESYTANGMPEKIWRNNAQIPEVYSWNNKLLTQKQYGTVANNILTWAMTYKAGTSLVETITDENGLKKQFSYDALMRLSKLRDRYNGTDAEPTNEQANIDYVYQYKDAANPYSFVKTTTTLADGYPAAVGTTLTPIVAQQFMDGLGRSVMSQRNNYTPSAQNQKKLCHIRCFRTARPRIPTCRKNDFGR